MLPEVSSPEQLNTPAQTTEVLSTINTIQGDPSVAAVDGIKGILRQKRIGRAEKKLNKLSDKSESLGVDLLFHSDSALVSLKRVGVDKYAKKEDKLGDGRPTYKSRKGLGTLQPKNKSENNKGYANARRAEKAAVKRHQALELAALYGRTSPKNGNEFVIERGARRYTRAQRTTMWFDERQVRSLLNSADKKVNRLEVRSGQGEPRTRLSDFRGKGIENKLTNNDSRIRGTTERLDLLKNGEEPSKIIRVAARGYNAAAERAARINESVANRQINRLDRRASSASNAADNDHDVLNQIENMLGTDAVNKIVKRATKKEAKATKLHEKAHKKATRA